MQYWADEIDRLNQEYLQKPQNTQLDSKLIDYSINQLGDKVRAAYNRAEYMDARREVLQWWADYLDSLNVSIEQEEPEQEEEKLKMWKGGNLY